jgi:maltooligosyltrehalose trehalohydrolase
MSARYAYPLPFGAELIDASRTRFRLWAPDASTVDVEIPGLSPIAMQRSDDGVFERTVYCGAGTCYRFRIDRKTAVPDPAARRQAEDVHGDSLVCDPHAYLWHCDNWLGRPWHEMVIYELHVGCCHGFVGVEKQLRDLAQLGITAIELMPIADFSGQRNWGYDGVLPFAPDVSYGSPAQLKQLIDSAHRHGLCVYLDVVYNHFGPDGNFLSTYASPFFQRKKNSPWGAAIDFSQPRVRQLFTENALYWLLEYRFDGLRFDAVHQIDDAGWLDEMAAQVRSAIEPGRHVHLILENEKNRAAHLRGFATSDPNQNTHSGLFDAQWNDDGHNVLHVLLTGESDSYYRNYREQPAQKLARCLAEGFVYQGEISPTHRRPRGTPSAHLPPSAFVLFLQNHDQIGNRAFGERLTTLVGEDKLRAAITLLLLCPQIPLLFMGEPWGTRAPFLFFTDFHNELAAAVREGRRSEFAALPAFSDPVLRQKIPDPNSVSTYTQSILEPYSNDMPEHRRYLSLYQQLLTLRRAVIVPNLPGCRSAGAKVIGDSAVLASWHLGNNDTLHIAVNFGSRATPLAAMRGNLLFASNSSAPKEDAETNSPQQKKNKRMLLANSALAFIEPAIKQPDRADGG